MEMRCLRKLLGITYRDHISNEEVQNSTWQAIGPHEDLLITVKRRKLKWYGHITRSSGLAKTILQGTVQGRAKKRQTEKEMGGQHPGMDGHDTGRRHEEDGEARRMKTAGCQVICGAPTVQVGIGKKKKNIKIDTAAEMTYKTSFGVF